MKLTRFALLIALVAFQAQGQTESVPQQHHVSILSTKKEVFYFKIDSEFMGATVAVTDSTGAVFFSTELHSKRNLIDFFYLEKGKYTIHFEHNGIVEDYQVWLDKKDQGHPFIAFMLRA
jgi:hypothetical protein